MTTQHTPSPWVTSKGAYGALHVGPVTLAHPGREVAQYAAERGRDLLAQRAADVALIAAAPDMLAALQAIAATSTEEDAETALGSIQMICRDIITKAKGSAA
jgi:hypothetical protein